MTLTKELAIAGGFAFLVTLAIMLCLWVISLRLKDVSFIDAWWGPGFAVIALFTLFYAAGPGFRPWMITACVCLWGLRLGLHLFTRWKNGPGEDARYAAMRRNAGDRFALRSLYMVFILQAVIMWVVSLPAQAAIVQPSAMPFSPWDVAGLALFAIGFLFETIGDAQLRRFKADPANHGKVLSSGLWAWTRHPNYFGDACMWWGIFVMAGANPGNLWTIIGPVVMTWFLISVSGKALLEHGLRKTKPGYAEYIASTSGFFPLPPRRRKSD